MRFDLGDEFFFRRTQARADLREQPREPRICAFAERHFIDVHQAIIIITVRGQATASTIITARVIADGKAARGGSNGRKRVEAQRRTLLKQIDDGVIIFEPLKRTSTGLIEFQHLVEELLAMERDGLIERCLTHKSEIAGQPFLCYVEFNF